MPFLVRKLSKQNNIEKMGTAENPEEMIADAPTAEFRTSNNGALSTWLVNSLEDVDEGVLAIAVTSTKVSKMDFVVIDTALLEHYNLEYKQTYAGQEIAVPDLQNSHYDIVNITMKSIIKCINVYKDTYIKDNGDGKLYFRYSEGEIKDILKKAIAVERIDTSKLNSKIKDDIGI
jgi:hypothetical protein